MEEKVELTKNRPRIHLSHRPSALPEGQTGLPTTQPAVEGSEIITYIHGKVLVNGILTKYGAGRIGILSILPLFLDNCCGKGGGGVKWSGGGTSCA